MRKLLCFLVLPLLLAAVSQGVASAGDLDGTAWRIHEKGKKDTEDLIFVAGNFTSSGCVPYGFLTSAYSSSKQGDAIAWNATQTNSENEKMVWKGAAKGSGINGTYVYTDKKGKTWTEEWMGEKLKAK
jgi:hypothetical protein